MIGDVYAVCESGFLSCFNPPNPYPIKTPGLRWIDWTHFITQAITGFLPAVFGIAGFLTVIFIVVSGIQFILSSGNPEGAAAARNRLIWAIAGFVLIILAFSIPKIIDIL